MYLEKLRYNNLVYAPRGLKYDKIFNLKNIY